MDEEAQQNPALRAVPYTGAAGISKQCTIGLLVGALNPCQRIRLLSVGCGLEKFMSLVLETRHEAVERSC